MPHAELLRDLLRRSIAGDAGGPSPSLRGTAGLPDDVELHRVAPLLGWAAGAGCLPPNLPAAWTDAWRAAHRRTARTNALLLHALGRAVTALRAHGVDPVVWKGAVLADRFHPHPGARWMGDVDLAIEPDERDAAIEAFRSIGFRAPAALATADALYFEDRLGVLFDVHHRVRLFDGCDPAAITETIEPAHVPVDALRVLEPTAFLVHLVCHLHGHRAEMGDLLCWLVDVAFLLRRWGARLDASRLDALLPDDATRRAADGVLRCCAEELGAPLSPALRERAADAPPLTVASVLARRRLVAWGLPGWKGWARVAACRMGLHPRRGRPWPTLHDLRAA